MAKYKRNMRVHRGNKELVVTYLIRPKTLLTFLYRVTGTDPAWPWRALGMVTAGAARLAASTDGHSWAMVAIKKYINIRDIAYYSKSLRPELFVCRVNKNANGRNLNVGKNAEVRYQLILFLQFTSIVTVRPSTHTPQTCPVTSRPV